MRILGIYGYSASHPAAGPRHNTGAAFLSGKGIVAAVEEERLSRIKNDTSYPFKAIDMVLSIAEDRPDRIAIGDTSRVRHLWQEIKNHMIWLRGAKGLRVKAYFFFHCLESIFPAIKEKFTGVRSTPQEFNHIPKNEYPHHFSHASSTYYCCPWPSEDVLVITLDGVGDGLCGSVWVGKDGCLDCLYEVPHPYSVGLIYTVWTKYLGFRPHRHEGKVLGLAAYGDGDRLGSMLLSMAKCERGRLEFTGDLLSLAYGRNAEEILEKMSQDLPREDIAAGVQEFTEKIVAQFVHDWVHITGVRKIAFAGGVFSNVKLNQRILEMGEVENIYIYPNMGDGGLAVGAAFLEATRAGRIRPNFLETVYLGPDISRSEAEGVLKDINAEMYSIITDGIEEFAAELLAQGKVIARAAGRMEYGPRALGNRSILASASDVKINQWLNARLERTEFMPFAPIIMEEYAADYFPAWRKDHIASRFMTITYEASTLAREKIPAAIHVDGTARPQVLRRKDNPRLHQILKLYHAKTGIPALINTSFNMHEEPIVCSALDALRAFSRGHLDGLILGPYLIYAK